MSARNRTSVSSKAAGQGGLAYASLDRLTRATIAGTSAASIGAAAVALSAVAEGNFTVSASGTGEVLDADTLALLAPDRAAAFARVAPVLGALALSLIHI